MPDVAQLAVTITADTAPLEAGLNRARQSVSGFGSAIGTAVTGAAVAGVAALGAAFVTSAKSAMDFEKQVSAIGAVSGASQAELEALTSTALQLGKDTSFSAREAAEGMEELVKAGVSVADVIGGAGRAALDLAAAGAVSVADAAEIASNAMNVFSLKGADMAHVADVIAGAANASAISVTDYKFSLAAAGAVAATVGIGFEDLSTAIAVMGQAGIKGSDAGTSLKTMLLNLDPSSKSARAAMKDLGLITADGANKFFDATGKAKSMSEIAGILQDAIKGLTKEQQINALQTIFGTDAVRAAAVMAKAGAEGFTEMAGAMGKVTAQAVAEQRLNNLAGSLEKLKGSLETGAIMLGSLFTPAIKVMVDALTEGVNQAVELIEKLPDAWRTIQQVMAGDWSPSETIDPFVNEVGKLTMAFRDELYPSIQAVSTVLTNDLWPAIQSGTTFLAEHAEVIAGVVAAYATFRAITTVVAVISALTAAWGALSAAVAASGGIIAAIIAVLGGPLTLAIVAIAAVVGVLVAAWIGNWFGIREATASAVAWISAQLTTLSTFLTTTWDTITTTATTAWTMLTETLAAAWATIQATFEAGVATVQALWEAGWQAVTDAMLAAWNVLTPENQQRVAELVTLMTELWTTLQQLWTAGTTTLTTLMTTWWTAAVTLWTEQTTALMTLITTWWQTLVTAWTTGQEQVTALVQPFWDGVAAIWNTMLTAIGDALGAKWAEIVTATAGLFEQMRAAFNGAVSTLGEAASNLGTAIMDALATAINAKVQSIIDGVTGAVRRALDAARGLLGGAGGGGNASWAQIAREEGVDPALLQSLIEQESGGNQGARSGAGAIGLTQLMPGTAAGLGVDPYDELQNVRGGARYLKQMLDMYGGDTTRALIAYNAGPGGGTPGVSSAYAARVIAGADKYRVPAGVIAAQRGMVPQIGQFSLAGGSLSAAEAAAFCGPAAAMWFANIYGRMPSKDEAEAMARQVGWTPEWGMAGPASEQRLLGMMGVQSNVDYTPTPQEIAALAAQNVPFMLSTAGHYYQVQGGSLAGLNVGASGTALAGGSSVMSLERIQELSGAINGIITLAPQMGAALTTAGAQGGTAFTTLAAAAVAGGQQLVTAATDAMGNVTTIYGDASGNMTAIVTNAAGQVTATFSGMNTAVVASSAEMSGGVTSMTAEMSNGVLTSVTDLGGAVMTITTDMAGNTIATITDMAGNVTAQYTTLAATTTATVSEMGATVVESTAAMSSDVLTSVTDLGDGVLTITTDMAGNTVATITDMAGNVTSTYTTFAGDMVVTTDDMAGSIVETMSNASEDIQGVVEEWGSTVEDELSNIADEAGDQAAEIGSSITEGIADGIDDGSGDVADALRDVVKDAIDEAKDEAESDSPSKLFARELGLPMAQGVAEGIMQGYGDVADASRGLVDVPAVPDAGYGSAMGGGAMQTVKVEVMIGDRLAEEIYVTGRTLAIQRGRFPEAGSLVRGPLS